MNPLQLILILCLAYGVQSNVHVVQAHRPAYGGEVLTEHGSYTNSIASFGPVEPLMKPIKSTLQKATVFMCDQSRLCSHEILNQPPFVGLLGPYQYHDSHRSIFSIMKELSPIYMIKTAMKDIIAGVTKAEEDILLAPFKPIMDIAKVFTG